MPNWVYNTLIFDSSKDLSKVWKGMFFKSPDEDDSHFSYENIIPSPKNKDECPDAFLIGNDSHVEREGYRPWFDWYKWQNFYWGVKWDACDANTNFTNMISFDSPWCKPNDEIFQGIADKFGVSFISQHAYEEDDTEEEYEWFPTNLKLRKIVALE